MSRPKFIQIHTLTTYPATLLNRDDAGFAKRLPFGGVTRTRVSSQSLKFHWRNFEGENTIKDLEKPSSHRSRRTFKQLIAEPLIADGLPARLVIAAAFGLQKLLITGKNASDADYRKILNSAASPELLSDLETDQVTVIGEPEVQYLRQLITEMISPLQEDLPFVWSDPNADFSKDQVKFIIDAFALIKGKELKKNLKALQLGAGLEAAIFGRMVTSDILARTDAAIHVAHSFTTHEQNSESDYFAAIDELKLKAGELGGGHINSSELTSGLFYGYVVVDIPLLVSNLTGVSRQEWDTVDASLAGDVIEKLIYLVSTVSPGAKLGSTAPYANAQALLVEAGTSQPRTLANAFQRPVDQRPDVLTNTYGQLAKHLAQYDAMYETQNQRRLAAIGDASALLDAAKLSNTSSIPQIARWTAAQTRGEDL